MVVSLALTGMLFAWNPQIESALHGDALTAEAAGQPLPLAEQVAAARGEHPGWALSAVTPAAEPGTTTGVTLAPPDADADAGEFGPSEHAVTVYVDPASAAVTGRIAEASRPSEWLRSLHSSWQLGPVAEPVTELAASWVLVSLLTGLYLRWPRGRRGWARVLCIRPHTGPRTGRRRWRELHTRLGVLISVLLLGMVGTGLAWTTYAGAWLDALRAGVSSGTPTVATGLHGAGTAAVSGGEVDVVAAAAGRAGITGPLEITPPEHVGDAWTAAALDDRWPINATEVAVDPATGRVLDRVDWADYPLLVAATTRGRARRAAESRAAAADRASPAAARLHGTLGFTALMVALPTLGVSFVTYLLVERVVHRVRRPAAVGS